MTSFDATQRGLDADLTDGLLPEFDAAKCVHGLSPLASCSICIAACPVAALEFRDGLPVINTSVCTGCGQCRAACPQSAFSLKLTVSVHGSTVLLTCEKCSFPWAKPTMSCVHSLGLEQLSGLSQQGVRKLALATGQCDACENCPTTSIIDHVAQFNVLAQSRDIQEMEIIEAQKDHGAGYHEQAASQRIENAGRRAFLRSLLKISGNAEREGETTPSRSLPGLLAKQGRDEKSAVFYAVPEINDHRCNGCDACINLCPESAITLKTLQDGTLAYDFTPEQCTGCAVCKDCCECDAISLNILTVASSKPISLRECHCRSCGVAFHTPNTKAHQSDLCRICAQANHNSKLFQVLE